MSGTEWHGVRLRWTEQRTTFFCYGIVITMSILRHKQFDVIKVVMYHKQKGNNLVTIVLEVSLC